MKDLLSNIDTIIAILIGVGTIITSIIAFVNKKLIKPFKAYEVSLNQKVDNVKTTLQLHETALNQLKNNGGSSIKDAIDRIENKVDKTINSLERVTAIVKAGYEFDDDGIFMANAVGNCYYFNRKYLEIAGLNLEEALNYGWTNAVHPLDHSKIVESWNNTVQTKSSAVISCRYKNLKSGRVIHTKVSWQVQVQEDTTLLIFGRVKVIDSKSKRNDVK